MPDQLTLLISGFVLSSAVVMLNGLIRAGVTAVALLTRDRKRRKAAIQILGRMAHRRKCDCRAGQGAAMPERYSLGRSLVCSQTVARWMSNRLAMDGTRSPLARAVPLAFTSFSRERASLECAR